jgi:hypothetical protein
MDGSGAMSIRGSTSLGTMIGMFEVNLLRVTNGLVRKRMPSSRLREICGLSLQFSASERPGTTNSISGPEVCGPGLQLSLRDRPGTSSLISGSAGDGRFAAVAENGIKIRKRPSRIFISIGLYGQRIVSLV